MNLICHHNLSFLIQSCAHWITETISVQKKNYTFSNIINFLSLADSLLTHESFPILSNLTIRSSNSSIQLVCISLFVIEKAFTILLYVICLSILIFVVLHILFFPVTCLLELSHLHFHIALSQHCKGKQKTIHNFLMYNTTLGCTQTLSVSLNYFKCLRKQRLLFHNFE